MTIQAGAGRWSIRQLTFRYLDTLPHTAKLSGWGLYETMLLRTGRRTTPATLLQYLRDWADIGGHTVECVNREASQYRVTRGGDWGVAGAFTDR